jgi:hypothetical protein
MIGHNNSLTVLIILMLVFASMSSKASTYTVYYDEGDEFEIGYGYKCSWNGSNYSVAGVDAYYGFLTKEVNGATFVGLAEVGDISYSAYTISFQFGEGESTYPPDGFEDIGEGDEEDEEPNTGDDSRYAFSASFEFLNCTNALDITLNFAVYGNDGSTMYTGSSSSSGWEVDGSTYSVAGSGFLDVSATASILPTSFGAVVSSSAGNNAYTESFTSEGSWGTGAGLYYYAEINETIDLAMSEGGDDEVDFPISPTNPPVALEPTDPSPEETGGDTSPEVAVNYEEFRDAVESALDNRKISQEEFQTAMENALNAKSLDGENIQNAMSNALKENNITQEGMYNAMGAAIQANNLSADEIGASIGDELDDRNLTADGIGTAVADAMSSNDGSGIVDAIEDLNGDIMAKLDFDNAGSVSGLVYEAYSTNGNAVADAVTSATNVTGEASGMIDFVEEWFGAFFTLDLPMSIGKQTSVSFAIPGSPPGVEGMADSIDIDMSGWSMLSTIRMMESIILHVCMVFLAARIYKSAW